ncbi:MAG: hypothetical protein HDS13_05435 [Bacteroides sp.]|nr:hypothetical protein [Bacteroides sp.]MDE7189065.1 J domain-containing protein [Muribaculaceae bacterium]
MNNPYSILGVSQDATNQEIIRAVATAMKSRNYSTREIAEARAILSKPSSRLAADFTFPIFHKRKNITMIEPVIRATGITVNNLNPDKYDSL